MTRHGWLGELPGVLKPGDRVAITDTDGRVTRGVVATITATEVTLRPKSAGMSFTGTPRPVVTPTFQADRVSRMTRGGDGVWEGVAIGAAAGLGIGFASLATAAPQNASDAVGVVPVVGALGAGVGFLVDAMINRPVPLLTPGKTGSRAQVRPILGWRAKGVAVEFRF